MSLYFPEPYFNKNQKGKKRKEYKTISKISQRQSKSIVEAKTKKPLADPMGSLLENDRNKKYGKLQKKEQLKDT